LQNLQQSPAVFSPSLEAMSFPEQSRLETTVQMSLRDWFRTSMSLATSINGINCQVLFCVDSRQVTFAASKVDAAVKGKKAKTSSILKFEHLVLKELQTQSIFFLLDLAKKTMFAVLSTFAMLSVGSPCKFCGIDSAGKSQTFDLSSLPTATYKLGRYLVSPPCGCAGAVSLLLFIFLFMICNWEILIVHSSSCLRSSLMAIPRHCFDHL
jgi:hypothetical protein